MWDFFSLDRYMPHAICFAEDPNLIATHVGADAVIALSYFSIPLAILYFVRERKDLAFRWVANLFILFIFWCGVSHVADLVTIWYPAYGMQATAKMLTALASVSTAVVIWMIMPRALALPSPADLRAANSALEDEVVVRREAESNLRRARDELERRVAERTDELQEANRRLVEQSRFLESIIDNAGSAIWVKGVDNRYLLVNREWCNLFDVTREKAVGYSDHDVLDHAIADASLRGDRKVIATKKANIDEDPVEIDSGDRTIITTRFPILSEEGELIAVGGIGTDVTALKQVQSELLEVNKQLVEEVAMREAAQSEQEEYARQLEISNTELEAFAQTASHDMKEPLRGISHYASFIVEDYGDSLPDGAIRRLTDIRAMAARLQGMIDSLHRLARSGRYWNPQHGVDTKTCIVGACEALRSYIDAEGVDVDVIGSMPVTRADPDQLEQLFLNLISNGIKYNVSDAKRIEIRAYSKLSDLPESHRLSALNPAVGPVFAVGDNGVGIPESAATEIFTVFRRLDDRRDENNSFGIGLSIAKRVVERHGGAIWTRPRDDGGSVFYFTLGAEGAA